MELTKNNFDVTNVTDGERKQEIYSPFVCSIHDHENITHFLIEEKQFVCE